MINRLKKKLSDTEVEVKMSAEILAGVEKKFKEAQANPIVQSAVAGNWSRRGESS